MHLYLKRRKNLGPKLAGSLVIWVLVAVCFVTPVQPQTGCLIPDWTNVKQDFFDLVPGAINPVLTAADVTDREATFVADPFLFREGSTWYMFFEVASNSGEEIGLASSSDGLHWTYQQIVLSEPFHLAYPYVFKWEDKYYMVPDTYSRDQVLLYRATNFPYSWTLEDILISGPCFLDSSIFRYNNLWWIFTGDEYILHLFYSDNLIDPESWHEHPLSPIIEGDTSKARGGGRVIVFDSDRIIRLTQKSDVIYCEAVRAFEVDVLTQTSYSEHEVPESPIVRASGSGWNAISMHTVDPWWTGDSWLAVVDGNNDYDYRGWSIGIYVSPLKAAINPTQVRMHVGQSQTFTSIVSGGSPPYSYQWVLNGTAVPDATDLAWVFTPTQTGNYSIYLNVTDSLNNKAQSNIISDINVYSVYLSLNAKADQVAYNKRQQVTFSVTIFNQLNPALDSSLSFSITGPDGYCFYDSYPIIAAANSVEEYSLDWIVPNIAGTYIVETNLSPSLLTAYDTFWLVAT